MINILYLHAGAETYGADKVLLDLITRLDKSRYNPIVILPTYGVLVEALREIGVSVRVIPYPIMRRKYFNVKGIIRYGYELLKYSYQLKKIAKKENVNIIHTNTAAVLEGICISRKLKIPQLWSIHEIIVSPKIMFKVTSKLIARYAKVVTIVSESAKNHLESSGYFNGNIKVIYNGVDSDRFNPNNDCEYLYEEWNIPKNAKVIGMLGRINSWKGQKDFLEAANILMAKHPDLFTVLVGSPFEGEEWREKELIDTINMSPFADRIVMKGYRTDSEVIFKLLDVFVLPSTNPDPLPTVVLEAMATGKPIVGYRHGGICEMVKEGYNGYLSEARDFESLADNIDKLISNRELRIEMGIHSRERLIECFSIDSYIRNYSDVYDKLVDLSIE